MHCYICSQVESNVPLLKCGCFLCPSCYCNMKRDGIYHCCRIDRDGSVCDKPLFRGRRKNRVKDKNV